MSGPHGTGPPANLAPFRTAPYSYIKHPMYTGYVISEIGLVLLNPLNAVLVVISISLYTFRAKSENRILKAVV